jgi:predicted DNA-binding transcriptional regulator AlpA
MAKHRPTPPEGLELQRILRMPEVEALTSLSRDTLRRRHRDKIVQLSPRRQGMKLGDALRINSRSSK